MELSLENQAFAVAARDSWTRDLVDFCRQDEVALRQAVNLVGPDCDFDFSPCQEDVRVVALLLGQLSDAVHKLEGLAKVGELETLEDVMLVYDFPPFQLLCQGGQFLTLERRDPSAARNAGFVR